MDASIMAGKNTDFLQPLLDMMNKRMDTLEGKVDDNTAISQQALDQAKATNGRLTRAERAIAKLQKRGFKKLNVSPNVIYLLALGGVLFLAIIAEVLHVNITRIIG